MFFFHRLVNNINHCIDMSLYDLEHKYLCQSNYIFTYSSPTQVQIQAIILVDDYHIIYLSNYHLTEFQSYSFIILLLYIISQYAQIKQKYSIETNIFNLKALSLYIWLGFNLVQQRKNYYLAEKAHGVDLFCNKYQVKNSWRRLLVLTIQ